MKFLLCLFFVTAPAFAQDGELVQKVKSEMLSDLDQRINGLTEAKACVTAANDRPALQACQKKLKAGMDSLRDKRKAQRQELKSKFQAKKAEKKK